MRRQVRAEFSEVVTQHGGLGVKVTVRRRKMNHLLRAQSTAVTIGTDPIGGISNPVDDDDPTIEEDRDREAPSASETGPKRFVKE